MCSSDLGEAGGRVVAAGTPIELASDARSITGPFLARELSRADASPKRRRRQEVAS